MRKKWSRNVYKIKWEYQNPSVTHLTWSGEQVCVMVGKAARSRSRNWYQMMAAAICFDRAHGLRDHTVAHKRVGASLLRPYVVQNLLGVQFVGSRKL